MKCLFFCQKGLFQPIFTYVLMLRANEYMRKQLLNK